MRSRGFTLLELMVAFGILSVVMVAVLRAVSTGLNASRDAAEYSIAVNLAQQKMEELAQSTEFQAGEETGAFDEPFDDYSYRVNIENTSLENLYRVEVEVDWKRGSRLRSTKLETVMYPAPEPAAGEGETTAEMGSAAVPGADPQGSAPTEGGAGR